MSFFSPKKPYSAVTVTISKLVQDDGLLEDDVIGIPELVESISLQTTGPSEAARAIRKHLKYGNLKCQLRALTILDGLLQNCGSHFQHSFVDEILLERLRLCGSSNHIDPPVKAKCHILFKTWATEYKNTEGLEQIAALYKQLPRQKQVATKGKPKVLGEVEKNPFEDDGDELGLKSELCSPTQIQDSSSPKSPSRSNWSPLFSSPLKKNMNNDKHPKKKQEKKQAKLSKSFQHAGPKISIKNSIAEASVEATCLMNLLESTNNDQSQISENQATVSQYETCKKLREIIVHYIQVIEDEKWISALLHANDQLVNAITTYEHLTCSVDADSDSDNEVAPQNNECNPNSETPEDKKIVGQLAGLHILDKNPADNLAISFKEAHEWSNFKDEDNPFADRNALSTPMHEVKNFEWKEV